MGRILRCFFMPQRDRDLACSCRRDTTFSTSSWGGATTGRQRIHEEKKKKEEGKCRVKSSEPLTCPVRNANTSPSSSVSWIFSTVSTVAFT
ncbi:hypothetical protein EYF80_054051 [Liparis tanakae]|uniref:Uncharacterized protein n=1 Tax=Liparis tanakae TaxID=230148 RepID=A0A4Z2F4V3_9TELE|nr:hypothetical protein EYF80_054051 [Liparis tanakae]